MIAGSRSDLADDAVAERLIEVVHDHVRLIDIGGSRPPGWRYPSVFHLLNTHGRRFTPAPRPRGVGKMPDGACYANAAYTARIYREHDLVYAEGCAAYSRDSAVVHLLHAWCVTPDGAASDPTWDADGGILAYFGVPVADETLWPAVGDGLLQDFTRCGPLLRDGLALAAIATRGQAVPRTRWRM